MGRIVELPLDQETDQNLSIVNSFTGVHKWPDIHKWPRLFGSRLYTARIALDYAIKTGIQPDPEYKPVNETVSGKVRPEHPLLIEVDGRFDGMNPKQIASVLGLSLRYRVGDGVEDSRRAKQPYPISFRLGDRTLREIDLIAFGERVSPLEQTARLVELAEPRILRHLPAEGEKMRWVEAPVDTRKHEEFSRRALRLNLNPVTLIAVEVRRMLDEGMLA